MENTFENIYMKYIKDNDGIFNTGDFSKLIFKEIIHNKKDAEWKVWEFRHADENRFIKIKRGLYLDSLIYPEKVDSLNEKVYLLSKNALERKYGITNAFTNKKGLARVSSIGEEREEWSDDRKSMSKELNRESLKLFELFELFKFMKNDSSANRKHKISIMKKRFGQDSKPTKKEIYICGSIYGEIILSEVINFYEY